jgi:outer membrane immunogenic protein
MHMKKLLLLSLSVVSTTFAMAATASAADLRARPYVKAPPPAIVAVYDWSGFYIGGNGGYGTTRNCWDFVSFGGAPLNAGEGCHNSDGAVAGGQIGYRWQSNAFVFGLEAQGNWADLRGSRVSSPASVAAAGDLTINSRLRAFGLFTGQVGYAWNNVLLYVKGGAAVVDNRYFHTFTASNALINSTSDTRWGGTVGVGMEYGFAPGWSFGVEYDHLFIGRDTLAFAAAPAGVATTNSIGQDVDIVTARINYRFGGSVIPRY